MSRWAYGTRSYGAGTGYPSTIQYGLGVRARTATATADAIVSVASYRRTVLADAPTSLWLLADAGTTAVDAQMANSLNGTYGGSYTHATPAILNGTSLSTVFSGGYVDVPDNDLLSPHMGGKATTEVIIQPNTLADSTYVLAKGGSLAGSHWEYGIYVNADGSVVFQYWTLGGSNGVSVTAPAGTIKANGTVYHLAMVYDTAATNKLVCYVNGQVVGAAPSIASAVGASSSSLYIGRRADSSGNSFKGRIAGVAIYPVALSQAQLLNHYNVISTSGEAPPSIYSGANYDTRVLADGANLFWPLHDATEPVLNLAQGNAHPGDVSGSAVLGASSGTNVVGSPGTVVQFPGSSSGTVDAGSSYTVPTTSFSYEIWAKPTASTPVHAQSGSGSIGIESTTKYLIHAAQRGSNTGIGLAVGTNFIGVYGHGDAYLPCLLAYTGSFTDWTHIVITVTNNVPSLYVNGAWVATGVAARNTAYASAQIGSGSYGYFHGYAADFSIYLYALSGTKVGQHYTASLLPPDVNFVEAAGSTVRSGTVVSANLIGAFAGTDLYTQVVMADGPSGFWKLDDVAGNQAGDYTNYQRPATIVGATLRQAGPSVQVPWGIKLNPGSSGHIALPTTAIIPYNQALTVEMWVNIQEHASYARLWDFGDRSDGSNQNDIIAWAYNAGETGIGARWSNGTTARTTVRSPTTPSAQTWHHIVIVYTDATTTSFINSVQTGQVSSGGVPITDRAHAWIGRSSYPTDPYLNATVSNISVYQKALTAQQITNHYKASSYAGPNARGRVTELWLEVVAKSVPRARIQDVWVETVNKTRPMARLTEQWVELVRPVETHVARVSVDVIVQPAVYASVVAMRARTYTATPAMLLDIVPREMTFHQLAPSVRTRTVLSSVFQLYSETAQPVNATALTPIVRRTRTSTATASYGRIGDKLSGAIDLNTSFPSGFNMTGYTYDTGQNEPDPTGGGSAYNRSIWTKYTVPVTGTYTLRIPSTTSGARPYWTIYKAPAVGAPTYTNIVMQQSLTGMSYYMYAYAQDTVTVTWNAGDTYYIQFVPYSSSSTYVNGAFTFSLLGPPAQRIVSGSGLRTRYVNVTPTVGQSTIFFDIGSPRGTRTIANRSRGYYYPTVTSGVEIRQTTEANRPWRTRMGTGIVTVDVPIVEPPEDVEPMNLRPNPPSVVVDNDGTGSLPGGIYSFKVAYYVGNPMDGVVTEASEAATVTLGDWTPPPPPPPPVLPPMPDLIKFVSEGVDGSITPVVQIEDVSLFHATHLLFDTTDTNEYLYSYGYLRMQTAEPITLSITPSAIDRTWGTDQDIEIYQYVGGDAGDRTDWSNWDWISGHYGDAETATMTIYFSPGEDYMLFTYPHTSSPLDGSVGGVQFSVAPGTIPTNTTFNTALDLGSQLATHLYNMAHSPYEPEPDEIKYGAFRDAYRSLWFTWTAPQTKTYFVGTGPKGTENYDAPYIDTYIGIYSGSAMNNLTVHNENDDGPSEWDDWGNSSYAEFNAVAGTTYYLRVSMYNDAVEYSDTPDQLWWNDNYYMRGPGWLQIGEVV